MTPTEPREPEEFGDPAENLQHMCTKALAEGGIRELLAVLNARVPHRFTGVYRFDGAVLRNIRLFDAENPDLEVTQDAPLDETYCSIVGQTGASFATDDARGDERLEGHPALQRTQAYCGVLLSDANGEPYGTLCHFDLQPRPWSDDEHRVMEAVAPLVAPYLPDPATYPLRKGAPEGE